jgi:hypothetical protein
LNRCDATLRRALRPPAARSSPSSAAAAVSPPPRVLTAACGAARASTDAVKPFRTGRCAGGDKVAAVVVVVEAAGQCRECKLTTRCYAQAQERANSAAHARAPDHARLAPGRGGTTTTEGGGTT